MDTSDFLSMLLRELKQLYGHFSLALLHKRMGSYHKHANHSVSPHAGNIKSSLLEYVDNVAEREKVSPPQDAVHSVDGGVAVARHAPHSHHTVYPFDFNKKQVGPNPYKLNKKQVSDLSRHFKTRKKGTEPHPGIKEKLKNSIWEHINASIQCAIKGDKRNAKMHVDIANYAFKEIAHYMPENQYQELTEKINKRLNVLKAAK